MSQRHDVDGDDTHDCHPANVRNVWGNVWGRGKSVGGNVWEGGFIAAIKTDDDHARAVRVWGSGLWQCLI